MNYSSSSSTGSVVPASGGGSHTPDFLGLERHEVAWILGGIFAFIGIMISFVTMYLHWRYNAITRLRHCSIWVLGMVPVYSICAWLGLYQKQKTEYYDLLRECYEAVVIYSFFRFMLGFLGGRKNLIHMLRHRHGDHIFPFCWLKPWRMGAHFLNHTMYGCLQYVPVKLFTAAITFVLTVADSSGEGKYFKNGDFSARNGYIYITFITNASQMWAMYSLVMFYHALAADLATIRPIPKFLCIKLVVFATFWQSVIVSALVHFQVLGSTDTYTTENVSTGLQDFLICIEMALASLAHLYAFPHREFARGSAGFNMAEMNLEEGMAHAKKKNGSYQAVTGGAAATTTTAGGTTKLSTADADDAEDAAIEASEAAESNSIHEPSSIKISSDDNIGGNDGGIHASVPLGSVTSSASDDLHQPLTAAHPHVSTRMTWDGTMKASVDDNQADHSHEV